MEWHLIEKYSEWTGFSKKLLISIDGFIKAVLKLYLSNSQKDWG